MAKKEEKIFWYRITSEQWGPLKMLLEILDSWWFQASVRREIDWGTEKRKFALPGTCEAVVGILEMDKEEIESLVEHLAVFCADTIKVVQIDNPNAGGESRG